MAFERRLPRESDPRPRGLHPVQSDDARSIITSVWGGAWVRWSWEYPPSFPELFKAVVGGWRNFLSGAGEGEGEGVRWVVLLVVDVPAIISDKFQQSIVYEDVEVPQIQFIDRVVDFSVVLQRRVPTVQTVDKTGEIPQLQFLDKVDDARCCTTTGAGGGSAVAVL